MACKGERCINAVNIKPFKFILCKAYMKNNVNYGIKENALTAICAHQYFCPKTQKMENTDKYKKCYEYLSAKQS